MVKNKLAHYIHHFLIANIGLFLAYVAYGSITVWEAILFFFMAFIPLADELFYAITTYLSNRTSRNVVNLFFVSEFKEMLSVMHEKRLEFAELILHNIPIYLSFSALLYVCLAFDLSIPFYALAGILTHLIQDIVNDQYEFKTLRRWTWPFQLWRG